MIRYYTAMVIVVVAFRGENSRCFGAERGPFEVVILNVSSCGVQQPWFRYNVSRHSGRRSVLRGNVVATRVIKNVKFHVRMDYLEDKTWVKVFQIKNQDCRNAVMRLMLASFNIQYDPKKCSMNPGTWELNNIDVDNIIHKVVPSAFYGLFHGRFEIYTSTVTLLCVDLYYQFVPRQGTNANN